MKQIFIVDNDNKIKQDLEEELKEEKFQVKKFSKDDVDKMIDSIPEMFIINEDSLEKEDDTIRLCEKIREDENNVITPIIVLSSNTDDSHVIKILKTDIELFLKEPINKEVLYYSIKNLMRLLNTNRTVSPLTGLPGNVQIQNEIKKRLKKGIPFALLYADLDNFKSYNDSYGFSKGDEIIKLVGRTLTKYALQNEDENNFVGHIGGDDFIAIVEGEDFEDVCQNVIAEFELEIKKYYSKEDIDRGYLEIENRKGLIEQFPLTSLSIGVVYVTKERFKNSLEIGEVGAAVKHLAKTIFGSTYVIDKRASKDIVEDWKK